MNQKGFANIILVIVIVVLLGAVGYFAFVKKSEPIAQKPTPTQTTTSTKTPTPTPIPKDETASWRSFTNAEFGYSFKYPSIYTVKEYGTDVQIYESSNTNAQYIVDFHGQKTNATLSSIIKDKTDGRVLSEARPTTINGLSGYEGVDQGMVSWYAVFVKDNSNLVEIKFNSTDKGSLQQNKAALTNTQKLILSTFRFTN